MKKAASERQFRIAAHEKNNFNYIIAYSKEKNNAEISD